MDGFLYKPGPPAQLTQSRNFLIDICLLGDIRSCKVYNQYNKYSALGHRRQTITRTHMLPPPLQPASTSSHRDVKSDWSPEQVNKRHGSSLGPYADVFMYSGNYVTRGNGKSLGIKGL